ncbi:PA2779 family protein [Thermocrinis minervae]|uniref:PA2779 family protein n=1 Tax=Thermocrinis minervae TaxID=381751 RepID=A0A1M6R1N3_9AQUI|nr:PA2779 family protein [Thermocrinis minervae]SHK26411.1 hypothetical protein SAMN05444391_0484 [Thermocrinis minervae]
MWRFLRNRLLVFSILGWFTFFVGSPAMAGLVESKAPDQISNYNRDEDINKIRRALENKLVQEKLKAYGLTKEEVEKKLSEMNDEQIRMLASASDKLLAGGDGLGVVVTVLVILILLVILLKLLNKEIIIR